MSFASTQRFGWALAGVVFALDQISKPLILAQFKDHFGSVEVTPFFNLVLTFNRGVSFGLFSNDWEQGPYLLAALAVAIAIAVWAFLMRHASTTMLMMACGLVMGGAFGNALDRLLYGAVVDFLDFHVAGYHWPAFNIADCAIVVGALLIAVDGLFGKPKPLT